MAKAEEKCPGHYRAPSGWLADLPAITIRRGDHIGRDVTTSLKVVEGARPHAVAYLSLLRCGGRREPPDL